MAICAGALKRYLADYECTPDKSLIAGVPVSLREAGNTDANKTDATAQAIEVLARVDRTLKAAGYDWSHIVDATVFLADMNTFQAMNGEYRKKFQAPIRVAVTGRTVGPPLFESMEILGQDEVLRRLRSARERAGAAG